MVLKNIRKLGLFLFFAVIIDLIVQQFSRYTIQPDYMRDIETDISQIYSTSYQANYTDLIQKIESKCRSISPYSHQMLGALGWSEFRVYYFRSSCFKTLAETTYDSHFCGYVYSTVWFGIPIGGDVRASCYSRVEPQEKERALDQTKYQEEKSIIGPHSMTIKRISSDQWNIRLNLRGTKAGLYRIRARISQVNGDENTRIFYDHKMQLTPNTPAIDFTVTERELLTAYNGLRFEGHFPIAVYLTFLDETLTTRKDSKNIFGSIRTYDRRMGIEETIEGFYEEK